jgi:ribosomal protein S12 methylthiotransferase accessory factor
MQTLFTRELNDAIEDGVDYTRLDLAATLPDHAVDGLAALLDHLGHPVSVVDITTEDVAPTGMRVVHTFAPGLYSNSSVGFPFLGGTRLPEELKRLGLPRRDVPLPH